jgi:hypothetical protein
MYAPSARLVHASQHQQPSTQAGGSAILALTVELCAQRLPAATLQVEHFNSPAAQQTWLQQVST